MVGLALQLRLSPAIQVAGSEREGRIEGRGVVIEMLGPRLLGGPGHFQIDVFSSVTDFVDNELVLVGNICLVSFDQVAHLW